MINNINNISMIRTARAIIRIMKIMKIWVKIAHYYKIINHKIKLGSSDINKI